MALWRLSERLRNRDWWGIAIDLAIVVLGVFLGIQASNWNQTRQDRAHGREYLDRIRSDLQTDADSLDQHELYWRDTAEAGDRALAYVEEAKARAPWPLLNDFYGAGQNWNHSTVGATYEELRSAGHLDLIESNRLRQKLADYYVARADEIRYLSEFSSQYRLGIRAAVPFKMQRLMLGQCQRGFVRLFTGDCPEPENGTEIAGIVAQVTSNRALMGDLRSWMANLAYVRSVGRDRRDQALSIVADIDEEIKTAGVGTS